MGAILSASWSLTLEPQLSWGQICLCPTRRQWSMCGDTLDTTKQAHTTGAFWLHLGWGCYCHQLGGDQGCCKAFCKAQDSSRDKV